jgi:hypothetical protein
MAPAQAWADGNRCMGAVHAFLPQGYCVPAIGVAESQQDACVIAPDAHASTGLCRSLLCTSELCCMLATCCLPPSAAALCIEINCVSEPQHAWIGG